MYISLIYFVVPILEKAAWHKYKTITTMYFILNVRCVSSEFEHRKTVKGWPDTELRRALLIWSVKSGICLEYRRGLSLEYSTDIHNVLRGQPPGMEDAIMSVCMCACICVCVYVCVWLRRREYFFLCAPTHWWWGCRRWTVWDVVDPVVYSDGNNKRYK